MGELVVRRREFMIGDPWRVPDGVTTARLLRATDASTPRLSTELAIYRDATHLHILFRGDDENVVATHLEHDAPLYEEDVVEAFLAPGDPRVYFELEVNPLGTTFDARIESPDGIRSTMNADLSWNCDGLFAAILRDTRGSSMTFATLLRIPFASLGSPGRAPDAGDLWRANFFRIDRSIDHNPFADEFSAWQPTLKTPADFHVAAAFGTLRFE
ncbi:MAG: hypothetical protein QOI24_598 [Acidobacteriota bacterium]|jgi:hypothetical protein|nr:hypothetical protein [Acidobacteriota bacterium]